MKSSMRKMFGSLMMAAALAITCSAAVYADDTARFVPGTSINGIGIGGLTVEEAKGRIEGFYASDYKLTLIRKGGAREYINGSDIGYRVTVPDGLQAVLDAQNASGRNSGPDVDNSHSMQMSVVYDEGALMDKVRGLSCVGGSGIIQTVDARISDYREGEPFTILPEVQGNDVDAARLEAVVKETVGAGNTEVNLESAGCYRTVQVTAENEQLKSLCETMNRCKDMVISYTFGEQTEDLPGSVICRWVTGADQGQMTLDEAAVRAYVAALAAKYDTAGTARNFRTTTGRDVSISGAYGWRLDQEAETAALLSMIRTGQSQAREPQYAQAAASRSGADWGGTYVEVDMAGQHVYMYSDGNLVWDAPCVTGNVAKGYSTPAGLYTLNYKQTDRILRGAKKADGTYEYESHVNYWMPFNGGIGLHDADWRSKFGGTIYQKNGSHGCINLPPAKAKALYGLLSPGVPVLCVN